MPQFNRRELDARARESLWQSVTNLIIFVI